MYILWWRRCPSSIPSSSGRPIRESIGLRPLFLEQGDASRRQANQRIRMSLQQSAIIRILPDREPRAGCAPRVHRFLVGAFLASHPLQKIEDQTLNGIAHLNRQFYNSVLGSMIGTTVCMTSLGFRVIVLNDEYEQKNEATVRTKSLSAE